MAWEKLPLESLQIRLHPIEFHSLSTSDPWMITIIIANTELSLFITHYSKNFKCIIAFNLHNDPCEVDSISLPIFGFGSWGKETLH